MLGFIFEQEKIMEHHIPSIKIKYTARIYMSRTLLNAGGHVHKPHSQGLPHKVGINPITPLLI